MFPCGVLILSPALKIPPISAVRSRQTAPTSLRAASRRRTGHSDSHLMLVFLLAIKGKYPKISSAKVVKADIRQPGSNQHSLVLFSTKFCNHHNMLRYHCA